MSLTIQLKKAVTVALAALYELKIPEKDILINQTKPEFEGDYTVVLFALVKQCKKSPELLGTEIGAWLKEQMPGLVTNYNVIKGFLNLVITDKFWTDFLQQHYADASFGCHASNGEKVMVEYASPNTNKPLHLGHLRNIFLGWSIAEIFKTCGYGVTKASIVNDRGIHICKSMIAWKMFAGGATPASTGTKGDHFVGQYYVRFNDAYKKQVEELINTGSTKEEAEKNAPIMKEAQIMLLDWEAGKPEIVSLWKEMNGWVYEGFDKTYQSIGCDFDKTYYESNTYLLGKKAVQLGLEKNIFFKKEDGSVWIDLTEDGLDQKLLLRKDGTSVYITQDIGLAVQKYEEYTMDKSIYVIGDEQNYHMKVLQLICKKLGLPYADGIHHLSYGMVELPSGRMKSREGTVVDADDMVAEMEAVAKQKTEELGKVKDFTADELKTLYHTIGLGALKFYLLRVDPKKTMIFNPEESIDFHGFTGPFIQFNYARIQSVLRKNPLDPAIQIDNDLLPLEKELLITLENYPLVVRQACEEMSPSVIAAYAYHLAKLFSSFYTEHSIAGAERMEKKQLRLMLSQMTGNIIKNAMQLLGITVPERM